MSNKSVFRVCTRVSCTKYNNQTFVYTLKYYCTGVDAQLRVRVQLTPNWGVGELKKLINPARRRRWDEISPAGFSRDTGAQRQLL